MHSHHNIRNQFLFFNGKIHIRPKKKLCSFPVTRPTVLIYPRPEIFYRNLKFLNEKTMFSRNSLLKYEVSKAGKHRFSVEKLQILQFVYNSDSMPRSMPCGCHCTHYNRGTPQACNRVRSNKMADPTDRNYFSKVSGNEQLFFFGLRVLVRRASVVQFMKTALNPAINT